MYCFSHINNPKFNTGGIQPYHCVQYGMWLYFLSNTLYHQFCAEPVAPGDSLGVSHEASSAASEAIDVCDKIFMFNMMITQMDIYYGHDMPDIWLPAHTSGSVFSPHAKIGNYFMFNHGCNVGLNHNTATPPIIEDCVIMMGHSKIIGNCHVGDHVVFGANSYIKNMDVPSGSLVFGQYPNVVIKKDRKGICERILEERFKK